MVYVYADCMPFGMDECFPQVTFQASNVPSSPVVSYRYGSATQWTWKTRSASYSARRETRCVSRGTTGRRCVLDHAAT